MDVSSDGRYLAVGGHDRAIHVWDLRTDAHVQAFSGHRGAVAGLAFRRGTHQLFSASFDRSVKIWTLDDMAYMDSLYGHQSEVVAIDCLHQERALSAGRDRTCRIWKVPDETQLVFRGHSASIDCCKFLTGNEYITGSEDGSVALWTVQRKKPVHVVRRAHGAAVAMKDGEDGLREAENENDSDAEEAVEEGPRHLHHEAAVANGGPSHASPQTTADAMVGGAAEAWVGAVAVCAGSDMAASGAGDGAIRLWQVEDGKQRRLKPLFSLPTKGFVNALAFAHSGKFLLAGTGQEPRLGRWAKIAHARNGVILHPITLDL
eukprot:SM000174S03367  [mRNA]  locus=s174:299591:301388:+ [translate_table: standard]